MNVLEVRVLTKTSLVLFFVSFGFLQKPGAQEADPYDRYKSAYARAEASSKRAAELQHEIRQIEATGNAWMNTHGFDPHQSARQDRQQKLREAQAQLAFASEDLRAIQAQAANAQSRPPRIKEKPRLTDPFAVAGTKKGAKGPSPAELATINANAVQAIVAYVESANGRPTAKTTGETPGETAGAKPVALPWINQLVSYFEYIASRGYQVHESIPETIFNDAEMNRHYGGNRRPEEAQSRLGALLNSNPSLKKTQFFVTCICT